MVAGVAGKIAALVLCEAGLQILRMLRVKAAAVAVEQVRVERHAPSLGRRAAPFDAAYGVAQDRLRQAQGERKEGDG